MASAAAGRPERPAISSRDSAANTRGYAPSANSVPPGRCPGPPHPTGPRVADYEGGSAQVWARPAAEDANAVGRASGVTRISVLEGLGPAPPVPAPHATHAQAWRRWPAWNLAVGERPGGQGTRLLPAHKLLGSRSSPEDSLTHKNLSCYGRVTVTLDHAARGDRGADSPRVTAELKPGAARLPPPPEAARSRSSSRDWSVGWSARLPAQLQHGRPHRGSDCLRQAPALRAPARVDVTHTGSVCDAH